MHNIGTIFLRLIPSNMEKLLVNFQLGPINALQEIAELASTHGEIIQTYQLYVPVETGKR